MAFKEISPLVSIVIPFFNEEKFLQEAIESVLQQYYSYWELILVDDGSTDKSSQMAIQFSSKYPGKIRVIDHDGHSNKGLSASRNLGIKNSKGEFVAFLDADDIWLPQKLSHQISLFGQFPHISMIIESSLYWYSWENPGFNDVVIPVGTTGDQSYSPTELMFRLYPLGKGAAPCPSGWIIKKNVFSNTGYFEESFNNDLQLYEDQAFLSKIYLTQKIYVSSACNNWYRQRNNSIVYRVKEKGKYHFVRKKYLEWLSHKLLNSEIQNPAIIKLIHKNNFPYRYPILHYILSLNKNMLLNFIRKSLLILKKRWRNRKY